MAAQMIDRETEMLIARRAIVLAQVAAYERLVKTLKEEAALLAKQANLTGRGENAILST